MIKTFYPDEYYDSTYSIDFESFYKQGYRGVLFDVDNTLVPHGEPADDKARDFFARLHNLGFKTCLISNNKERRVAPFAQSVKTKYVYKADKPSRSGYIKGMELIGCNLSNTLFVGDQLFTDVWGAKRTGIRSILVKPINPKEEIQIVLKRIIEKPILKSYERNRLNDKRNN